MTNHDVTRGSAVYSKVKPTLTIKWSTIFNEEVFASYLRGSNDLNSHTEESIPAFAFLLPKSLLSDRDF